MTDHYALCRLTAFCVMASAAMSSPALDWPRWGRDHTGNMMSPETGLPDSFAPGRMKPGSEEIDMATTKNIRWVAKLGSQSYGNITVGGGRVFVGTNNETPRNPKHTGDRGVVMCFDERSGRFLWQLLVPKLEAGKVSDWEYLGICSSPTIDGNRIYVVTNRCEVVCLDVNGLADGNDGPFQTELSYIVADGSVDELSPTDADIIWRFDMRDELGVFPHNVASSSVLVVNDRVYVTTSNGVDWSHKNIPSPFAPSLVALDKLTGKLVGEEAIGLGKRIMHCSWSSPTYGSVSGRPMVFYGGPDGFCYAFDPKPVVNDDGYNVLKEIWRFDCNPPEYRLKDGKAVPYAAFEGPSEIISTPVFHDNKIYVAIGQDPEHGTGLGNFSCIDASKSGDVTKSGKVWSYQQIDRSISTASIVDGLVYIADYAGHVHCLDAQTGECYWKHDTKSHIWSSTLVADGKVYIGNEDGTLTILKAGKELKAINTIDMGAPIYGTTIVANGVLYVQTQTHLFAIEQR